MKNILHIDEKYKNSIVVELTFIASMLAVEISIHNHIELSNNVISQLQLIFFGMAYIVERKKINFEPLNDIRNEPIWPNPDRSRPTQQDTDFKIAVSSFWLKLFVGFEIIALLDKQEFCNFFQTFLRKAQETLIILKIRLFYMKESL